MAEDQLRENLQSFIDSAAAGKASANSKLHMVTQLLQILIFYKLILYSSMEWRIAVWQSDESSKRSLRCSCQVRVVNDTL